MSTAFLLDTLRQDGMMGLADSVETGLGMMAWPVTCPSEASSVAIFVASS